MSDLSKEVLDLIKKKKEMNWRDIMDTFAPRRLEVIVTLQELERSGSILVVKGGCSCRGGKLYRIA